MVEAWNCSHQQQAAVFQKEYLPANSGRHVVLPRAKQLSRGGHWAFHHKISSMFLYGIEWCHVVSIIKGQLFWILNFQTTGTFNHIWNPTRFCGWSSRVWQSDNMWQRAHKETSWDPQGKLSFSRLYEGKSRFWLHWSGARYFNHGLWYSQCGQTV